jgi:hypothetical protein
MTPSPTLHVIAQLAELFDLLGVAVLVGGTFVTCGRAIDVGRIAGGKASYLVARRTFGKALLLGLEVLRRRPDAQRLAQPHDLQRDGAGAAGGGAHHLELLHSGGDGRGSALAGWPARAPAASPRAARPSAFDPLISA